MSRTPSASRGYGDLFARFAKTALERPDDEAMTFLDANMEAHTYTYEMLFTCAQEIADRIEERGLPHEQPIGLLLQRQEAQVLHYLGALAAGRVPAVLTPPNKKLNLEYYSRTMSAVLDRSRFGAVVTDVPDLALDTPTFSPGSIRQIGDRPFSDAAVSEPLDASFLQFSSGTTGFKRGVLVTDRCVLAQIDTYSEAVELTPDDRILSWLPLYHDMGFIACLNMPLAVGVPTIMIDPIDWVTDPSIFLRAVHSHRATLSWNPNFAYAFMAQRARSVPELDLSSLRGLVNCSEPATVESQQLFVDRFAGAGIPDDVFWGCYAMAETTFALTHGTAGDPGAIDPIGPSDGTWSRPAGNVSAGRPLPGVELRIVDPGGREVGDRTVGEILVRSPFNFDGYHNQPEVTRDAIGSGWYRTGDLGYTVDGALYVPGRKKDVLIVGGVNVFPNDIEDLVGSMEGIVPGRVSAFSEFDARLQTERIIVLAESELLGDDARRVVLEARQRISAALQVANFQLHLVPPRWLVKSSSGKMARSANRARWTENR